MSKIVPPINSCVEVPSPDRSGIWKYRLVVGVISCMWMSQPGVGWTLIDVAGVLTKGMWVQTEATKSVNIRVN